MTAYLAPALSGGRAYLAPAVATAVVQPSPAPTGSVTTQTSDGGQSRHFVLATANATGGSYKLIGQNGTADVGPTNLVIANNGADFTVAGIPAGAYLPVFTLTGPNGNTTINGTAFTIVGVSGGGGVEPPAQVPVVQTVTVSPSSATVQGGTTKQYSAIAAGLNNPPQTFNWTTNKGTVVDGLVTAPAATSVEQTGTVTAASTLDPNIKGTATFIVPATVIIIPPVDPDEPIDPVDPSTIKVAPNRILRTKAEDYKLRDSGVSEGDTYVLRNGVWVITKDKDESLYYGRDIEPILLAVETEIDAVTVITAGVVKSGGPYVIGTMIVVKVSGGDDNTDSEAPNLMTLRVKCTNGEMFDLTIYFAIQPK